VIDVRCDDRDSLIAGRQERNAKVALIVDGHQVLCASVHEGEQPKSAFQEYDGEQRERELLRLYIRNVGNAVGPEGKYGEPSPSLPSNSENKAVVLRLGLRARNGDLVKCVHAKGGSVLSRTNTAS